MNMGISRTAFLSLVIFSQFSCVSMRKTTQKIAHAIGLVQDVSSTRLPSAPEGYNQGLELLQKQSFTEALALFDELIRQEPTSAYSQVEKWHSGRALEGLGRWTEAAERYRSVSVACEGVAPKLQAMALYRLSFTSEALADDSATVATLYDLIGRADQLPEEIAHAELPARIASAYARVGNFDEAVMYYKRAEAGISQLRRASVSNEPPVWLPRTLYFMGSMSLRRVSWNDFESALRPLARGQAYLLQAAEFGVQPWSEKSSQDLIATYRELWRAIRTAPNPDVSDPFISARKIQRRQWDRASLVLENIHELKARFLRGVGSAPPSEQAKSIEIFSVALEKDLNHLLEQRPAGEGLTPESVLRRRSLRGTVVSPDSTLERRYLESVRPLPTTLPATHLPDKTDTILNEDPNL